MYRVIGPEGEIRCQTYEMTDHGIELYDGNDEFIGFVPFENLYGLINEDVHAPESDDPSIM